MHKAIMITVCAYKVLGLLHHTLLSSHSTSVKASLYVSLVQSQLF